MGFGPKAQRILWSKIREIGVANEMNPDEAVQKFIKDVELYGAIFGANSSAARSLVVFTSTAGNISSAMIICISAMLTTCRTATCRDTAVAAYFTFTPILPF